MMIKVTTTTETCQLDRFRPQNLIGNAEEEKQTSESDDVD